MVGLGRFFLTEISLVTGGGVDLAQLLAFFNTPRVIDAQGRPPGEHGFSGIVR